MTLSERLTKQINFIVEIDGVKKIMRQNVIIGEQRQENDAEHSWHLAIMACVLAEYAGSADILKVIKMVLVHDLVELYAGDTFCYDEKANIGKDAREQIAADRVFELLPAEQAVEFRNLWQEFEDMSSAEAKFAACLDRLQPLILNYYTRGHTWQKPEATSEKVLKRNQVAKNNFPEIWEYACHIIGDSIARGFLKEEISA